MKLEFRMNKLSATLYNGDSELVRFTELWRPAPEINRAGVR